ncbi:MAG TPA: twin-arginine translocase subunit TatC [Candidatus Acidoferrales bacterium]|nr:twin-arginine translocase subunit TatC [Candidatus Acidoferrales bacterium]
MTLLERVLQRGPRRKSSPEDSRMTVIEHLEALRRALIVMIVAWTIATVGSFFVAGRVIDLLLERGGVKHAIFLKPAGGFFVDLNVALYLGFVIAAPVIIQQAWWFVSPGLHTHERRLILPLILATLIFFAIGIAAALYALPLYLKVLNSFAPSGVVYLPDIGEYVSFVLGMIIGFGLVFELPVVLWTLGMLRIISSRWLYRNRAYWWLALGVAAQFLTPGGDPFTPLIMAVPLVVFFEGTALLLKLSGR